MRIIPGTRFDKKQASTEVCPTQAYRIISELGGMSIPKTEALDMMAAECPLG